MSPKKRTKEKRQRTSETKARLLRIMEPFFLPGDVEPTPEKPCSVKDLLTSVAKHLDSVAWPDFGGIKFTEEERTRQRLFWTQTAIRELWNWIAAHAQAGNFTAQGKMFETALGITQSFVTAARQKAPGIVRRAKGANLIPGFIARDKCVQESMARLCREIGQGTEFPFPQEPPGVKGKKQKAKLSTAQHDLVNRLWDYMEGHRRRVAHAANFADTALEYGHTEDYAATFGGRCSREDIPLVLLSMMELPPLTPETWKQWRDVGRRVIEEHTNGNPAQHPAFQSGGFFASLGMPDVRAKRQEITLWKRLGEAWELRAESMGRLPPSSPHSKEHSRR
jgi:hypothetical protein